MRREKSMDNLKNQGNYADREINCDLMRVMSMVFVIAIHVSRKPFENHRLLLIMMSTFWHHVIVYFIC